MKSVVNHLEKTLKEMDEAIKIKGARILEMEVSLTHAKLRLSEDIIEAAAICKAIEVLSEGESYAIPSDDDLPTRFEGSE